jgi:hypothetical protein
VFGDGSLFAIWPGHVDQPRPPRCSVRLRRERVSMVAHTGDRAHATAGVGTPPSAVVAA